MFQSIVSLHHHLKMQIKVGTINMDNAINPSIMKKYGLSGFIALLLLTAAPLSGQTLDQFKQQAAQADPTYQTRVTAIEHGSAATAIKSMQVHPTGATVPGYRVRIFLDNGQNARSSALAAKARFNEIYPDIPAYWKYDAPYFSVSVGNCLTSEEAIILWGKINSAFTQAFIIRTDIPLSLFGEAPTSSSEDNSAEQPE